ncbi:evC complex member EVC-like isoform X2 [Ptychodera flava]|uniref:evC complex member EVC-like isoform X2 n=1 Tax=Ptychodera flava TaxID=63121 RepID=UPI00396A9148
MSCPDITVVVPASVTDVNVGVVVVCAILGFIVGVILTLIIARCLIRDIARARVQEEEKAMLLENIADERQSSVGSIEKKERDRGSTGCPSPTNCIFLQPLCNDNEAFESDEETPRHKPTPRRYSSASADRYSQAMERYDEDEADAPGDGIVIALTRQSSEKIYTELSIQDIRATKDLENELHEQKVMSFLQVLSIILNRCVAKGKIEPEDGSEFMEKYEKEIQTEESKIQEELKYAEEELRQDERLSKDPLALEDALDRLRPAYIRKMNNVIKTAQMNLSDDFAQKTELSQDEIDAIMEKLTENMAALDKHLGDEASRQAMVLRERLAKRQAMAEKWKKNEEQEKDTNRSRVDDHYKNMDKLIDDRLLLEGQRDSIMRQYEADLAQLQENHEAEVLRQSRTLAEKLRQQREKRMKKLEVKHQEQKEALVNKAGQVVDPIDFVEAYHGLAQRQREEKNQFIEELDNKESEELENLRLQLQAQRDEELEKQEESLYELLAQRARLTEKETEKLMKKHDANMKAHNEQMEKEKKRQRAKMQEQLAEKRRKWEEDNKQLQSENKALIDQQEAAVQKVLTTQSSLDEEARRAIMMNHEANVQALTNQLQMTKVRQQKILEAKLQRRKNHMEALKKKQEEEMLAKRDAGEKEIAKLEQKHEEEMEHEMQTMEEEKNKALLDLRRRLAMETEEALKAQDEQMSLLIGKLTVGQARRKGIIAKQDKAIKELQEQMTEAFANEDSDAASRKTEKILDRHLKNVEELQERMAEERESQMRMLKEKFEARKLKKEKEAEYKLAEEKNAPAPSTRKKSMTAASVMNRLLMDQRHKKTMADLEKELKLEMTRQKEELDQELEEQMKKELEEREKDLLSQLAVVGNLSKDELNDMVHNAVEEGGGSEKQARKLTKDLTHRIKSAKSRGDFDLDEEDEDEYRSERRRQTKAK